MEEIEEIDMTKEPTTKELLEIKKKEAKELTEKLKVEKSEDKKKHIELKAMMSAGLENEKKFLKIIQDLIYAYNKLGKTKKFESKVVGRIQRLCHNFMVEENKQE